MAHIDDPRITVAGLLIEAESALVRRLDAELRARADMPLATFEVLIRLGRSPGGRLGLSELGRQLSLTTGGVTRLVDRLEAQSLLSRVPDSADRRITHAVITRTGRSSLRRASAIHLEALQRDLVDPLSARDYAALARVARVLRDHLTGDPALRTR
jgi:MarR family 2-MHQ and catechol resistance regulon transcriptional repressor